MPLSAEINEAAKIPNLDIEINGVRVYPLSGSVTFSQNNTNASGTFSFATTLAVAIPGARIVVTAGFNGFSAPVFSGYLERPSAGYGATGGLKATWNAVGWLKRAAYPAQDPNYADAPWPQQGLFQGNRLVVPLGTLISDVGLWDLMMTWGGLAALGITFTPGVNGGLQFGSKFPVVLRGGQSPLDLVKTCDQINGFTTIDAYDGSIIRIRVDPNPVLSGIVWSYREGDPYTSNSGSIYEINRTFDPNSLRNRVVARGLSQLYVVQVERGIEMMPGLNNAILTYDMGTNSLCDDLTKLGYMAAVNLIDYNRRTDNVRMTVAGNPLLSVGSWIGITSGRIGLNTQTPCVIREITHTWDAKSYVSQIMCTPSQPGADVRRSVSASGALS